MSEKEEVVPLKESMDQVAVAVTRLALMHLAFSKTLVEALGEEKGKELIIKSILEYGKRVGERTKHGHQGLPYYGIHDRYVYAGKEYFDTRKKPIPDGGEWDYSLYRVYGCILAKVFREYGENELGRLYCYVDSAKSMAADRNLKLVHTACEPCGDEYCAFDSLPTTEKEQEDFVNNNMDWREVDPVLAEARCNSKKQRMNNGGKDTRLR